MFGPAGVAYVYLIYGVHHCLNFVTEQDSRAGAVLVRALEPVDGREAMIRRRGLEVGCRERDVAAGPGKLCSACGIDLGWNGLPLVRPTGRKRVLWLERPGGESPRVVATPRIGIRRAADRPYRFTDAGSNCLSR